MFILATRKVLFSKNCKTLRLCIKHFYCKVIRSTQWASPSQQRKGFMATCRFCTPTGGVETLFQAVKPRHHYYFQVSNFEAQVKLEPFEQNLF